VTPETTIPGTISQETLQALTVTTVEANKCLELVGSGDGYVGWDIGALKRTVPDGPRLWNDSISIPLGEAGAEPSTMFREFQTNVCEDPILGSTWAYMFAHMEIGGVRVIDLNPWLEPFAVEPEEINDVARSFVPLVDVANPSTEQQTAAAEANRSWQAYAVRIVTLFERFTVGDVQSWTSVWNMHLTGGGVIVGNFPEVGVNPNQEALPALILSVTEKGQCAPIMLLGINVGDQRPEEFAPPACGTPPVETVPPGTNPPHGSTPPSTNPPTTMPPSTTVPPTTVPPCPSGKCTPPTTLPPSPETTTAPTTATTVAGSPTTVSAGHGATNTSVPPTTVAPAPPPPTTAAPVVPPTAPAEG
jgi:hypothetical protein